MHTPLLHEAIPNIAHSQIRNRGTVGGSLAHADPASELPVIALAMGARFRAQSKNGERWIEAKDFFSGLFSNSLQADEFLVEIAFPAMEAGTGYCFTEVARRSGDYAMAGLAALLKIDGNGVIASAKLVYLNVGDGPVEAIQAETSLVGRKPDTAAFSEAARIASELDINPFGNVHATAEYQRHLSRVLTERALAKAHERTKKQ
jgi:carbon-monoxide dehydrogenase medium subunit